MMEKIGLKPGNIAVIFISIRPETSDEYQKMDAETLERVEIIPGFLGWNTARNQNLGIFISYWEDEASVMIWKKDAVHQAAKKAGRDSFYTFFRTIICTIEHVEEWQKIL